MTPSFTPTGVAIATVRPLAASSATESAKQGRGRQDAFDTKLLPGIWSSNKGVDIADHGLRGGFPKT